MKTCFSKRKIFLLFGLLFFLGFIISSILTLSNLNPIQKIANTYYVNKYEIISKNVDVFIKYEDIDENEQKRINLLFNTIKPEYLEKRNNFIVTKNMKKYCNDCSGLNINNSEQIIIKYDDDDYVLKDTITHEILHGFIIGEDEASHKLIYEVSEKNIIFK